MNKSQKIIMWCSLAVFVGLAALIVVLIVNNSKQNEQVNNAQMQLDSIAIANDRLQLTNEFNELNSDFAQYEDQQVYLQNDSLIEQYNSARARIQDLLSKIDKEKANNKANRKRIKQLEAEVATLKGIVKHYLEEIKRLGEENEGLKKEIEQVQQRNQDLTAANESASRRNEELSQTVQRARKLNITGLSLKAYNKKDKNEKNITKARKLGVSFTVSPNATAAPGMKDFYVRIIGPEGNVLGGGPAFNYDGSSLGSTAHRQVEYANEEISTSVYYNVASTLTPGSYRVEVFCDGYRLASRSFEMKK
ncbi:MAG: hypothetical protein NC328_00855 [Muribaculum sp.]|nr:hypothetical protein [Muribaculum sp.]